MQRIEIKTFKVKERWNMERKMRGIRVANVESSKVARTDRHDKLRRDAQRPDEIILDQLARSIQENAKHTYTYIRRTQTPKRTYTTVRLGGIVKLCSSYHRRRGHLTTRLTSRSPLIYDKKRSLASSMAFTGY